MFRNAIPFLYSVVTWTGIHVFISGISLPCVNCIYKSKPNTRADLVQEISCS